MSLFEVSLTGRFYADTEDEAFHLALGDLYSMDVNVVQVRDPDPRPLVDVLADDALNDRSDGPGDMDSGAGDADG